MKKTSLLLSMVLLACGSVPDLGQTSSDEPASPSDEPRRDYSHVVVEASTPDAGSSDASAASDASTDAGATCAPRIGHCLTHMATLCYETSFDDSDACSKSGLSSGWSVGPCETTRSSGGCLVGCDLSYSYRLGGYAPDDTSRAGTKINCESFGGIFIDTTTDGYDSSTN
jgi:hypothetical protein